MTAYCQVYGVIHFTSPAGWLPIHQDQLRAQRSVTSMGKLYLFSIAKHLSNNELLYYTLSINLLLKELLKFVNIWQSYRQNGDCFMRPICIRICPQRCWSHQISWITCVLRTETVTNHCYVNRQTVNYQEISNWLIDWQTDAISD